MNCKKVIDTRTGKIYASGKEASLALNIPHSTIRCWLNGSRTNYSTLKRYNGEEERRIRTFQTDMER